MTKLQRGAWLSLICLCAGMQSSSAAAAVSVWLDYTGFETRLGQMSGVAVTPYDSSEIATLRSGIKTELQRIYSPFDITFSETQPTAPYDTIHFGNTASLNVLGDANRIDFRNQHHDDVAEVYTTNFAFIVNEFSGLNQRNEQIRQLTMALASTAAHELAHTFGLMHRDAYSTITFDGLPKNGTVNPTQSAGVQNLEIMSTGSTGLGEAARETERNFSDRSLAKLEFADGLLASTPASILETAAANNSAATAQPITLTAMTLSPLWAANIVGGIASTSFDFDYYRFEAEAGTLLSADIMAKSIYFHSLDAKISLLAADGVTELGRNDDTRFDDDLYGIGALDTLDSMFLNVLLPTTGAYFLKVDKASGTGAYQLFLTAQLPFSEDQTTPEPSTLLLLAGGGAMAFAAKRFRRR